MARMHCPHCGEEVTVKTSSVWGNCWSCGEQFPLEEDSYESQGVRDCQEEELAADDVPEDEP